MGHVDQQNKQRAEKWRDTAAGRLALGFGRFAVELAKAVALLIVPLVLVLFLDRSRELFERLLPQGLGWLSLSLPLLAFVSMALWAGSSYFRRRSAEARVRILERRLELEALRRQRENLRILRQR